MSATNRGGERRAYDFYATPPETVRAFLDSFDGISSGDRILEPSAGNGQIIRVLREYGYDNRIDAVELRPEERAALEPLADIVTIGSFFDYDPGLGYDVIIGNPPYSMAMEFINWAFIAQSGCWPPVIIVMNILVKKLGNILSSRQPEAKEQFFLDPTINCFHYCIICWSSYSRH